MLSIQPATLEDLPEIAALERAVFSTETYPPFFFRQALDLWPRWLWIVRDAESRVQGYGLAAPALEHGHAWILSMAIAPTVRGRGCGARLLTSLLGQLRADGVTHAWLTVHPENPARRLYERHGFTLVHESPHYFGADQSRLVMRREGLPTPP